MPLKKACKPHEIHFMYQFSFSVSVTVSGDELFATSQITDTKDQLHVLTFFFLFLLISILTFHSSTFQSLTKLYRIQLSRYLGQVRVDDTILLPLMHLNTENILVTLAPNAVSWHQEM